MRLPIPPVLLLLGLSSFVLAGPLQLHERQDPSPAQTNDTPPGTTPSTSGTTTKKVTSATSEPSASGGGPSGTAASANFQNPPSTSITGGTTPVETATSSTGVLQPSENAMPGNELPFEPRLTPGWGVAGAILLITGVGYTLVGIKNAWLQTFFSTAYLGGLCTAILIVYLMYPPIPDGIQGAYVVACVIAGGLLGGASTIFHELTEGFGCLLGGFCLGMWLLTLKAGGLLIARTDKIIFIAVFSVVGFAFSFSRYTRSYALIASTSFSGATVTILGIDSFSRAGLKEFWAFIWDINPNLFPADTTSFPLTKGITVETALIVIIALVGVVSQLKLWRVIQERRKKKEEHLAELERQRDIEETAIGQKIEETNARERKQWEKTYGDPADNSGQESDTCSRREHKPEADGTATERTRSIRSNPKSVSEVIEMSRAPLSEGGVSSPEKAQKSAPGLMSSDGTRNSRITVRVAREIDELEDHLDTAGLRLDANADLPEGSPAPSNRASVLLDETTSQQAASMTPQVVPLPFTIPPLPEHEDHDDLDDDDRSSFATFADDDDCSIMGNKRASRASLGTRLSVGSNHLLHRLSMRSMNSQRSQRSKRATGEWKDIQAEGAASFSIQEESHDAESNRDDHNQQVTDKPTLDITTELGDGSEVAREMTASKADSAERPEHETAEGSTPAGDPTPAEDLALVEDPATAVLTPERLPRSLSRVALSYRTNEWAKHLSQAELPKPERLSLNQYNDPEQAQNSEKESAVPVDVHSLQRTDGGIPNTSTTITSANMPSATLAGPTMSRSLSKSSDHLAQVESSDTLPTSSMPKSRRSLDPSSRRVSNTATTPPIVEEADGGKPAISEQHAGVEGQSLQHLEDQRTSTNEPEIPGVVSYASPQTLLGQREMFLRNKSTSMLVPAGVQQHTIYPPRAPSEMGDIRGHEFYQGGMQMSSGDFDLDDLTLAQRQQLMRQNSLQSQHAALSRTPSIVGMSVSAPGFAGSNFIQPQQQMFRTDSANFDSHQPQRMLPVASQAQRDMALASFRQSVAADLGASAIASASTQPQNAMGYRSSSNLIDQISSTPATSGMMPTSINLKAESAAALERSRSTLISQKEQETQRKEMVRLQKEHNDRRFEELMRRGDLMDAHRDAMRKMQGAAR